MNAPSAQAAPTPHASAGTRRVLLASLIGTAVEFYDFYIYATAASLVFGPLFFPASSPSAQLLASYASFSIAFIARPLGAAVFGHFGDRIGRKSTLVASLLLMGGSTLAIAFLPTYQTAGALAPLLLCLLRFGQGFGLGGEWGGAALLAVENAPPGQRARFGMFPQLGAPVGFIASNGAFLLLGLLLTPEQFMSFGYRLPFLASAFLVAIGLWIRLRLTETPAFAKALEEAPPPRVPFAEVFRQHLRALIGARLLWSLVTRSSTCAPPLRSVTARPSWASRARASSGYSSARSCFGRGHRGCRLFVRRLRSAPRADARLRADDPTGLLMAPLFGAGSLLAIFAFLSLALFLMGFVYGPLGAFLPALFPARVRYTGASLAFNIGGILGGALAPPDSPGAFRARGSVAGGAVLEWCGVYQLGRVGDVARRDGA